MTLHTLPYNSPLGPLTLIATATELHAILWPHEKIPADALPAATPILTEAAAQLDAYFAKKSHTFTLPRAPRGTDFQRQVWAALAAIPFGQTTSYAAIARTIGRPAASRAVGAAVGSNPWPILIPCHRVIGSSGNLTGFQGGLPAKHHLLHHESLTLVPI